MNHVVVAGNTNNGLFATNGVPSVQLTVDNSVVASNGSNGIRSDGAAAIVRISNNLINNNSFNGLLATGGAKIFSFGNNHNHGNATDGTPTDSLTPQ